MDLLTKTLTAITRVNLVDLKLYDLENKNPFYNFVLVATGTTRQANAVLGYLKEELKNAYEIRGIEGKLSGWLLIDLGELIIHLFDDETRKYFKFDERFVKVKEIEITNQT